MHKRVALSVLAIAALLVSATPAFANGSVDVYPVIPDTYHATTADSIHLFWGWVAATKGLVRVFIGHSAETYTLLDSQNHVIWSLGPEEADAYWGPIIRFDPADWGWDCPMRQIAVSWWEVTIPPLPEGTYTLVFDGVFEQPVNDGLHACGDVGVSVPTPSLSRGETVVVSTIIVE
jgi:hypothetical protein